MIIVLILFFIGFSLGIIFKTNDKLIRISNTLVNGSICLLLFFLGLAVGINEDIMNSLPTLGLQSILLTLFILIGTLIISYIAYKILFKSNEK